jgi:hypothetical protein
MRSAVHLLRGKVIFSMNGIAQGTESVLVYFLPPAHRFAGGTPSLRMSFLRKEMHLYCSEVSSAVFSRERADQWETGFAIAKQ